MSKAKSDNQSMTEARKRHQFLLASKKAQGSGFSETHWSSWQRNVLPDRSFMSGITVSWPGGQEHYYIVQNGLKFIAILLLSKFWNYIYGPT